MRAGALSDAQVGAYLKEHFVSTWKRVSTFTAIQKDGKTVIRVGGNVAIYFCTPDYEVIHAIAGPVGKDRFLSDARWAVETWKSAREKAGGDREKLVEAIREAHKSVSGTRVQRAAAPAQTLQSLLLDEPLLLFGEGSDVLRVEEFRYHVPALKQDVPKPQEPSLKKAEPGAAPAPNLQFQKALTTKTLVLAAGGRRNMHGYLADRGLPKLDEVYKDVFERVLAQRVTDQPVRTQEMPARGQTQTLRLYSPPAPPAPDMSARVRELQKQVEDLKKQLEELKAKDRRTY